MAVCRRDIRTAGRAEREASAMLSRRTYTIIFALDLFVILSLLAYVITFFYLDTLRPPKTFISALPWLMPWMLWVLSLGGVRCLAFRRSPLE